MMNVNVEMEDRIGDALDKEAEMMDVISLMGKMKESEKEEGEVVSRDDEIYHIRNLTLALRYIDKDIEEMNKMKDIITRNWNEKILSRKNDAEEIRSYIKGWVENKNQGETLRLDTSTISLSKPRLSVKVAKGSEELIVRSLKENGIEEEFMLEPKLDQKKYLDNFKENIEKMAEAKFVEFEQALKESGEKMSKTKLKEKKEELLKEAYQSQANNPFFDISYSDPSLMIRKTN